MRNTAFWSIVSLILFATAASAVTIPVPLPPITMEISPTNPTSADTISLALSGLWPDTCPPRALRVNHQGNLLLIDMLLPGAEDCNEPACNPVETAYQVVGSVGPLPPGSYSVNARAVSCNAVGESEFIGSFTVGFPAGGPGGLTQGTCVVLLADDQPGLPGLQAGRNGTIVCSTSDDPLGPFLISWNYYFQGDRDTRSCTSGTPVIARPNSMLVVDPRTVPLGTCFDTCGTVDTQDGCIILQADGGQTFNLVDVDGWLTDALSTGEIQFGSRVHVSGLLSTVGPRPGVSASCPRQDGDIHEPVITFCAPSGGGGCCAANYKAGDRVMLLVDNPRGLEGEQPANLLTGARGTVVCCDSSDPNLPIFVSWDGFTEGSNTSSFCTPPIPEFPAGSGWWVSCDEIAPLSGGGQPCVNDKLLISFGNEGIRINRDPACPAFSRPFSGCILASVETASASRLSVKITPVSGMNGTWTATITPEEIPAGNSIVQICVEVEGIDLSTIPAGQNVQVATISLNATSL